MANKSQETAAVTSVATAVPAKKKLEQTETFAYIGPSLPGGMLKQNTILHGTRAAVEEHCKTAIDLCPAVAKLIVPTDKNLQQARNNAQTSGNYLHKCCGEVVAAIKAKGGQLNG